MSEDMVTTEELSFMYSGELLPFMQRFMEETGVTIEVVSLRARDASGFPTVRLHGPRAAVKSTLMARWDDGGSTAQELELFAEMMLGDQLAAHRYTTGCKLGIPQDELRLCPECREAYMENDGHICTILRDAGWV